jgi:hypothetical protein
MKNAFIFLILIVVSPIAFAKDSLLILVGQVEFVTLYRNSADDNVIKRDGRVLISNACGRYEANVIVKEVLVGSYSRKKIKVQGTLGEWCDPHILLTPDHYVFQLRFNSAVYTEEAFLPLFQTTDGGLAALPYFGRDLAPEVITAIDFERYYSGIHIPKGIVDHEFWKEHDRSWFEEHADEYVFAKGVPLEAIIRIVASGKSIDSDH